MAASIADRLDGVGYDLLYGGFGRAITSDARGVVRRAAERHIGWVRGDFDHLT